PELHVVDAADPAPMIEHFTSDQVADVRANIQCCALCSRKLYLAPDQRLGVADALDAGKLQNHKSLVQPMRLELQPAPFAALIEREQHLPLGELLGEIGVQLGGPLSLASLGLHDAGDGDEFGGRGHRVDFGYSSSTMSSEYRFFSFM